MKTPAAATFFFLAYQVSRKLSNVVWEEYVKVSKNDPYVIRDDDIIQEGVNSNVSVAWGNQA